MLGIKKVDRKKLEELGYELDEDEIFYTKVVDGTEITFEEEGVILMCDNEVNYYNSENESFNQDLIQDLIDEDLVEDKELTIGEEKE